MPSQQIYIVLASILMSTYGPHLTQSQNTDFCEFDKFQAECKSNEVVVMDNALYGRMRLGKCVTTDLGFVGCYVTVLDLADRKCSGHRSCSIDVPDEAFSRAVQQECMSELKPYLQANYTCLEVAAVQQRCDQCEYIQVRDNNGYIASVTTEETSCGSQRCPWLIRGQPGQKVNLTLIDFSRDNYHHGNTEQGRQKCGTVYATIRERALQQSETVCAGAERERHVYTSFGHEVELRIVGKEQRTPKQFLFKYQVFGCPDPEPPSGGWVKRTGSSAVFGCNRTGAEWTITCVNDKWQGQAVQCDRGAKTGRATGLVVSSLPYGLSIAVILAVAVVVGLLILGFGLFFVRRKRFTAQPPGSGHTQAQMISPYKVTSQPPQKGGDWSSQQRDPYKYPGDQSSSGYAHIWERPLPTPAQDSDLVKSGENANTYGPMGDPSYYEQSISQYGGSTLGGQTYGIRTLARREENRAAPREDDPRYFQLDPEVPASVTSQQEK